MNFFSFKDMKDINMIKASFLQTFTYILSLIYHSDLIDIRLVYIQLKMYINTISVGGQKVKESS